MSVSAVPLNRMPEEAPYLELARPQGDVFVSSALVQGEVIIGQEHIDWSLRIPEDPLYDGLGLFVPGYIGIHKSSSPIQSALAEAGIATLAYAPARYGEAAFADCRRDPQALHVSSLQAIVADVREQETTIKNVIPGASGLDFNKFLMIMHSMGGLSGPRFALTMPSGIDAMHGLATVGFGHPTLTELAVDIPKGLVGAIRHELVPAVTEGHLELSWSNLWDIHRYYQNLGRFMCEGWDCRSGVVIEETDQLAGKGIPYHYLAFGRDILVRADPAVAELVASYTLMEKYGHLAPQVKSEQVARYIATLAIPSNFIGRP